LIPSDKYILNSKAGGLGGKYNESLVYSSELLSVLPSGDGTVNLADMLQFVIVILAGYYFYTDIYIWYDNPVNLEQFQNKETVLDMPLSYVPLPLLTVH